MKIIFSPLGTVTTRYGAIDASHPRHPHSGIDFACPSGTELHSPIDGVVNHIVNQGSHGLGKGIFIKTSDGYEYVFGHLSEFKVKVGEHISKGEIIGLSGSTGHSTGPHLHFAVKDASGHFVDPLTVIHKIKTSVFEMGDKVQTAFASMDIGDKIHNLFQVVMENATLV
jgi:murein DD-endopeptidase MepM/ murein hydrolase activator NlpD